MVLADWTSGQFPDEHLSLSPTELWLLEQYAAEAYWPIKLKVLKRLASMARGVCGKLWDYSIVNERTDFCHFQD